MGLFSKSKHSQKRQVYTYNREVQKAIPPVLHEPEKPLSDDEAIPPKMWERCPGCNSILYSEDVHKTLMVCTQCGYHFRLHARERIAITADEGSFDELNENLIGANPLAFPDYEKKQQLIREKLKQKEGIVTGKCTIGGNPCILAVMDCHYMMGSMGAALGEKFTRAAEAALEQKIPLVVFTASGGARMQEGLVSLMQMAKTSAVLTKLDEAGILYITVLTDPTTGGVTASFAMLGDIALAEPGAIIGFAGRRVIEQTVKQTLPDNFQKSEFALETGFVDKIVKRQDMKRTLSELLKMHSGGGSNE